MGRKLAYTVHVTQKAPVDPDKPDGDQYDVKTEIFERGQELPDWAAALVGDHVYEAEDAPPEVAPNGAADRRGPNASRSADEASEKPAGNASLEAWQQYAAAQGVDVEGKSRDEIRDQFNS
ncbi:MAG: hypothetical protein ACXVX9_12865 [Mycobacteriaceae bacterium]